MARTGKVAKITYVGSLPQHGKKVFDSGEETFIVGDGKMIRGVDIGVTGMQVGERRRVRIPAKLGYGKRGKRPKVPPHAELEFDLCLRFTGADFGMEGEDCGGLRGKLRVPVLLLRDLSVTTTRNPGMAQD